MEEGSKQKQMGFVLRNSFLVVALVLFLAVAAAAVPAGAEIAAANAYNGSFSMQWHAVEEEEWTLDSETSRRILHSTKKYIDYRVIRSRMAAVPAPSGHPYKRGCTDTYKCRKDHPHPPI